MEHINNLRDFYSKNKDCNSLTVSLKEGDIFKYLEEILQFTEHKNITCSRRDERWTIIFSKK